MLRSAYFHDLVSSLKSKPGKLWKHFQSLSRQPKPACEVQVSAWVMLLMIIFCQFPTRTLLMWLVQYQLLSSYMDKLCDRTTHSLEFVPIDVESVSLIISSLHVEKVSGADGLSTRFVRAFPYMARLVTVLINKCIEFLLSGSRLLLHLFLNVSRVQVCLIFVQSLCYLFCPRF